MKHKILTLLFWCSLGLMVASMIAIIALLLIAQWDHPIGIRERIALLWAPTLLWVIGMIGMKITFKKL
jgi:hypothetical protein